MLVRMAVKTCLSVVCAQPPPAKMGTHTNEISMVVRHTYVLLIISASQQLERNSRYLLLAYEILVILIMSYRSILHLQKHKISKISLAGNNLYIL